MDLMSAISQRRTTRRFSGQPSEDQVQRILEAGSKAPSASNKQAWFTVVVTDPDTVAKIGDIKKNQNAEMYADPEAEPARTNLEVQKNAFRNCTTLVFYTYAPDERDPHRYDHGSVWLLVENVCLAAVEEGLGTQIVAFWNEGEKALDELLHAPARFRQVVAVNVGRPDPTYRPPEQVLKSTAKWIFHDRWPEKTPKDLAGPGMRDGG